VEGSGGSAARSGGCPQCAGPCGLLLLMELTSGRVPGPGAGFHQKLVKMATVITSFLLLCYATALIF